MAAVKQTVARGHEEIVRKLLHNISNKTLLRGASLINGEWTQGGATYPVHDPATGTLLQHVSANDPQDAKKAILAASQALDAYKKETPKYRSNLLKKWHQLIMDNRDDLATIMTAEQGKPFAEACGEVAFAADFVEFFAHEVLRPNGYTIPALVSNVRTKAIMQPVGVVACITPWNFPLAMLTRKLAPAFAAGCTAIVKPAEDTPLCAIALSTLAQEAGFPKGVLNIVTGPREVAASIGTELATNTLVRKISFTGSTRVGKLLMAQSAANVKKLSLELGGNAPFIVFDDADMNDALEGAMLSKFRNAGQTCVTSNRFYIHASLYESFVAQFVEKTKALKVGLGLDEGTNIGPLINAAAVEKVHALVTDALAKGATLLAGGAPLPELGPHYYAPTILANVTSDMEIASAEIFGPVAALQSFTDEKDVLHRANDTSAGLAAYLYSTDRSQIVRVSEGLDFGMIGVNSAAISNVLTPFGGLKESGLGREGSVKGMEDFLESKYICNAGLLE